MIMKRKIMNLAAVVAAAALFAVPVSAAGHFSGEPVDTAGTYTSENVTKTYGCRGFTGLDISGNFEVTLTKSSAYKVVVSYPVEIEKYIIVRVEGSDLKIGWKSVPANVQSRIKNRCTAEISMPELRELEMGGATSLECADSFDLGNSAEFSLDLSGASSVKSLCVNAGEFDCELSGASRVDFEGDFRKAELEISGASNANLDINADRAGIEVSGASNVEVKGKFGNVDIESSGAGNVELTGSAGSLSIDASGAGKVNTKNLEADNVTVEASGASNCCVRAVRSLTVIDVSGASTVKYSAPKDLNPEVRSCSRASHIKRVD
jgi:hypothetical protein